MVEGEGDMLMMESSSNARNVNLDRRSKHVGVKKSGRSVPGNIHYREYDSYIYGGEIA